MTGPSPSACNRRQQVQVDEATLTENLPSTTCPANTMYIVLNVVGEVIVDHMPAQSHIDKYTRSTAETWGRESRTPTSTQWPSKGLCTQPLQVKSNPSNQDTSITRTLSHVSKAHLRDILDVQSSGSYISGNKNSHTTWDRRDSKDSDTVLAINTGWDRFSLEFCTILTSFEVIQSLLSIILLPAKNATLIPDLPWMKPMYMHMWV